MRRGALGSSPRLRFGGQPPTTNPALLSATGRWDSSGAGCAAGARSGFPRGREAGPRNIPHSRKFPFRGHGVCARMARGAGGVVWGRTSRNGDPPTQTHHTHRTHSASPGGERGGRQAGMRSEVRAESRGVRAAPRLPARASPSTPPGPARSLHAAPQSPSPAPRRPLHPKQARNSPKPEGERGQHRPDARGPWPRLGGGGQRKGVPEPPLDVKALKGPGAPPLARTPPRSPGAANPHAPGRAPRPARSRCSQDASEVCPAGARRFRPGGKALPSPSRAGLLAGPAGLGGVLGPGRGRPRPGEGTLERAG